MQLKELWKSVEYKANPAMRAQPQEQNCRNLKNELNRIAYIPPNEEGSLNLQSTTYDALRFFSANGTPAQTN